MVVIMSQQDVKPGVKSGLRRVFFIVKRTSPLDKAFGRNVKDVYYVGSADISTPKNTEDMLEQVYEKNGVMEDRPIVVIDQDGNEHPGKAITIATWFGIPKLRDYLLIYDPVSNRVIYAYPEPIGWTILYDSATYNDLLKKYWYEHQFINELKENKKEAEQLLEKLKQILKKYNVKH